MTSNARIDSELEAFMPLFPPADLTDPVTARKDLAELAAAAPEPDTTGMEIEDRTIPADPDVPVRIYRPHRAHGAIIWLHGGGFVMGDLETEHPWAARVADGLPAPGSRPRWPCGRVTNKGRRSASSCSASPSSMTGRRRGRHGTSLVRPS